jgi:F0F1-type ATP synthase assembly protein I
VGEPSHERNELARKCGNSRNLRVTSVVVRFANLAPRMQAASPSSFDPAGAGGVLLGALLACIGLGVLIGWLAGSPGIGALIGAVVGILAGIVAVYRRYRDAF